MNDSKSHAIWSLETGITELQSDPHLLSASEIPGIKAVWTDQRQRLQGTAQLSVFTEKLGREWAIETGIIENLYDIERGVTQTLIEYGFQAELLSHGSTNQPAEYVIQLLRDHQEALEGVFAFVTSNRNLSTSYIKELHAALLRSQKYTEGMNSQGHRVTTPLIKGTWKEQENYPVRDGITYTYCPPEHVDSEMDRLIKIHASHVQQGVPSDVQSAWLHHRFTQIHPFQDGNGRVARAISSLIFVKDGLFPLVVRRDDKPAYISALEAADNGCLQPLIDLFARLQRDQFRKATLITETILLEEDVQTALEGLHRAADRIALDQIKKLQTVFDLARDIEDELVTRFGELRKPVEQALQVVEPKSTAFIRSSDHSNSYYYRSQIIQNAKNHLGYYANTAEYRSWVTLNMFWTRRSRLVFAIHAIGKPFNGSLICAPFLEFMDTDDDDQTRSTVVPVTEEGFVFFYSDDKERLLSRFKPWHEQVLKVALKELAQNL